MKRLSNKIMDIERRSVTGDAMYNLGHDDAKHDACNMAMAYDDVMASLKGALEASLAKLKEYADQDVDANGNGYGCSCNPEAFIENEVNQAEWALSMARELDEHQKTEGVE